MLAEQLLLQFLILLLLLPNFSFDFPALIGERVNGFLACLAFVTNLLFFDDLLPTLILLLQNQFNGLLKLLESGCFTNLKLARCELEVEL